MNAIDNTEEDTMLLWIDSKPLLDSVFLLIFIKNNTKLLEIWSKRNQLDLISFSVQEPLTQENHQVSILLILIQKLLSQFNLKPLLSISIMLTNMMSQDGTLLSITLKNMIYQTSAHKVSWITVWKSMKTKKLQSNIDWIDTSKDHRDKKDSQSLQMSKKDFSAKLFPTIMTSLNSVMMMINLIYIMITLWWHSSTLLTTIGLPKERLFTRNLIAQIEQLNNSNINDIK